MLKHLAFIALVTASPALAANRNERLLAKEFRPIDKLEKKLVQEEELARFERRQPLRVAFFRAIARVIATTQGHEEPSSSPAPAGEPSESMPLPPAAGPMTLAIALMTARKYIKRK